jgi:MSHA biogenesis protein MshL
LIHRDQHTDHSLGHAMREAPGQRMKGWLWTCAVLLAGCATPPPAPSTQHLDPGPQVAGEAPAFAAAPALPKPPKATEKPELYSVVVHDINVQELLFALSRDAKLNVSIHPGIAGNVTLSMLDQTLPEILDAICAQVDMRYELKGKKLSIMPDTPYLKMYRISYPNIERRSQSNVSISTNIASTGEGSGGSGNNSSSSTITNTADNRFWETLITNLRDLLRETDPLIEEGRAAAPAAATPVASPVPVMTPPAATPANAASALTAAANAANAAATGSAATSAAGRANAQPPVPAPAPTVVVAPPAGASNAQPASSYRETASVIANRENGIINVRATQRQHEKVREFLDGIMSVARLQVLIEATIVEVDLSDRYQQGIDWTMLRTGSGSLGLSITPTGPSSGLVTSGLLSGLSTLTINKTYGRGSLDAALRLLESFGTLRVLSSPKLSVLNSQTSVLKVVDNEVYFTIDVTPGTPATLTSPATQPTYTSTIHTVPIGFLMTVTPQISDDGEVILNLRPTISRISAFATDPSPVLAQEGVVNRIPIVQSREMESIMRVQSGDIAVLGGLIQDSRDRKTDGLPGANRVPVLRDIFRYQDDKSRKTELVIFIRPTVLGDASLEGDFRQFRSTLPKARSAFEAAPGSERP